MSDESHTQISPAGKVLAAAIEWEAASVPLAEDKNAFPPEPVWERLGQAERNLRDAVREYLHMPPLPNAAAT